MQIFVLNIYNKKLGESAHYRQGFIEPHLNGGMNIFVVKMRTFNVKISLVFFFTLKTRKFPDSLLFFKRICRFQKPYYLSEVPCHRGEQAQNFIKCKKQYLCFSQSQMIPKRPEIIADTCKTPFITCTFLYLWKWPKSFEICYAFL